MAPFQEETGSGGETLLINGMGCQLHATMSISRRLPDALAPRHVHAGMAFGIPSGAHVSN
uniref:Uncharacterized protein n=1 Tax=Ralstonia solanacearum TaxID=305 RepID=A0A0S4U9U9_RALSL|nr:protein of unknown function [Ralstonia solanacearum]